MNLIVSSFQGIKDEVETCNNWHTQAVEFVIKNQERFRNMVSLDFGNMTTVVCALDVGNIQQTGQLSTSIVSYSDKTNTLTNFFYAKKTRSHDRERIDISVGEVAMNERKDSSGKKQKNVIKGDSVKQILFRDDLGGLVPEYDTIVSNGRIMMVNGDFQLDPERILDTVIRTFMDGEKKSLAHKERNISETEIVITHPSGYNGDRIEKYKKHVERMGFKKVYTCAESTAACYQFIVEEQSSRKDELFFIVDIGHGTTDVTVCQINKDGSICEIWTDGLTDVGGRDYTRAIAEDIFHTHIEAEYESKEEKRKNSEYQTDKVKRVEWKGWSSIEDRLKGRIADVIDSSTTLKECLCQKYEDSLSGQSVDNESNEEDDYDDNNTYSSIAKEIINRKEEPFRQCDKNPSVSARVSPTRVSIDYEISYKRFEQMTMHLSKKIEELLQKIIEKCRALLGEDVVIDKVINVGGGSKVPILVEIEKRLFDTKKTQITKARSTTCVSSGALFKALNDCIEDEESMLGLALPRLSIEYEMKDYGDAGSMAETDKFSIDHDVKLDANYKKIQPRFKRRNKELWSVLYKTDAGIDAKPFALPGILLPTVASTSFARTYTRQELEEMKNSGKVDHFLIASKMITREGDQSMNYEFRRAISKSKIGLPMTFGIDTRSGKFRTTGTFNYCMDVRTCGDLYSLSSGKVGDEAMEDFMSIKGDYKVRSVVSLTIPFDKLGPLERYSSLTAIVHLHMIDNDKFTYYYNYVTSEYSSIFYTIRDVNEDSTRRVVYKKFGGCVDQEGDPVLILADGREITVLDYPTTEQILMDGNTNDSIISITGTNPRDHIYYGLEMESGSGHMKTYNLPLYDALPVSDSSFDDLFERLVKGDNNATLQTTNTGVFSDDFPNKKKKK